MPVVAPGINRFSVADFMTAGSPWGAHRSLLDRIISRKTIEVIANLDAEFGADWSWGQIHQISFCHSLAKHEPWAHLEAGPDTTGGSATTLAMAVHLLVEGSSTKLQVYHGPAFRWVVDLADPLHFRFVIAGGNGGTVDSPFTINQYQSWLSGEYYDVSLVLDELDIASSEQFSPIAPKK
jgi:penicillin amidase